MKVTRTRATIRVIKIRVFKIRTTKTKATTKIIKTKVIRTKVTETRATTKDIKTRLSKGIKIMVMTDNIKTRVTAKVMKDMANTRTKDNM